MGVSAVRVLVAAACLLWLSGCSTSTRLPSLLRRQRSVLHRLARRPRFRARCRSDDDRIAGRGAGVDAAAGHRAQRRQFRAVGKDPNDDVSLGKKHYHAGNFGNAERHFRRAVEQYPKDAEAWVGLAASYDRLKRFDLADRAYAQATKLIGDTPELLNNKGYSLLLRGDYARAKTVLLRALALAPDNPYIRNNLDLLEKSRRNGKAVR